MSGTYSRILFALTVVWGATIMWLAPHPPMIDLPQHAGQLALLQQLLTGDSPWKQLFQINFFTPYFLGFSLALPLSFVMPVAGALKLLLSLAYVAFVAVCVALRRNFGADTRLDWLFVTGFFGFAFKWGFFTFLMAAPLGLWFILLSDRYAREASVRRGAWVAVTGAVLLVSHGLVFMFSCLVAAALLTVRSTSVKVWLRALWPFAFLGCACLVYFFAHGRAEAGFQVAPTLPGVMWQLGLRHEVFSYVFGTKWTPLFAVVSVVMLMAPWLMGLRVDLTKLASLAPFAVVAAVLSFVPSFIFETSFVYQRFALFLIPTYAWLFKLPLAKPQLRSPSRTAVLAMLMIACWSVLMYNSIHTWRFGKEAADFDRIAAELEPGQRALALVFERASEADQNLGIYTHYPLWYQAEHNGLVDFNFAWVPPQIVRYRVNMRPPVMLDFPWRPGKFDWVKHAGQNYRYFFVRSRDVVPSVLFRGAPCPPTLLKQSGTWKVYERGTCSALNDFRKDAT